MNLFESSRIFMSFRVSHPNTDLFTILMYHAQQASATNSDKTRIVHVFFFCFSLEVNQPIANMIAIRCSTKVFTCSFTAINATRALVIQFHLEKKHKPKSTCTRLFIIIWPFETNWYPAFIQSIWRQNRKMTNIKYSMEHDIVSASFIVNR